MMINLSPIAFVKNIRAEIQDDHWGDVVSVIELDSAFSEEALFQIESFSHAEIVFYFHLVDENKIETGARHPRNNQSWPKVCLLYTSPSPRHRTRSRMPSSA